MSRPGPMARLGPAPALVLALATAGAGLLGGCGADGLSFRLDQRVEIEAPGRHAHVRLPVTVRWSVHDFATGEGDGSFGVVVDRIPPPPGKGLDWLFRDDDSCGPDRCPDPAYRAQRGVYETDGTEVVLQEITTQPERGRDGQHEVTIILLDADGRRVGEGAWSRDLTVETGP